MRWPERTRGSARVIRAVGEPGLRFREDPLRILSQRRAEFIDVYHNLVESDSLLPSDNLGSKPGAQRFNGTTWVLEPATA